MKPSHPPIYKLICSQVFVDTADRSAYTCVDSPSLDGARLLPLFVSPLRPEIREHAHEASAHHSVLHTSRHDGVRHTTPFLRQAAPPDPRLILPVGRAITPDIFCTRHSS
jgi:hypothetical protein